MFLRRKIELTRASYKREVENFPLKKWYNNSHVSPSEQNIPF